MKKTFLTLDYDNRPCEFVINDLIRIMNMLNINFRVNIYRSSKRSYHARSDKLLPYPLALAILHLSNCSEAYKSFVAEQGKFFVRTGEKVRFSYHDGNKKIKKKQTPKLICSFSKSGRQNAKELAKKIVDNKNHNK